MVLVKPNPIFNCFSVLDLYVLVLKINMRSVNIRERSATVTRNIRKNFNVIEPTRKKKISHTFIPQTKFSNYSLMLNSMEARLMNYIKTKKNYYNDLKESMNGFFQREIDSLQGISCEYRRMISNIKLQIPSESTGNYSDPNVNHTNSNLRNTFFVESLENEIKNLNDHISRTIDNEDQKNKVIAKVCNRLLGRGFTTTNKIKFHSDTQILIKSELNHRFDMHLFDFTTLSQKRWHFENIRLPIESSSVYFLNRYFICGGRNEDQKCSKDTFEFIFDSSSFIKHSPMKKEKRNHSLISIKHFASFYSLGGYNAESGYLRACEKYSLKKNTWRLIPSLKEARQDITPCLINTRFIYVIGGALYNKSWIYPMSIEYFDALNEEGEWEKIVYRYCSDWSGRVYIGAAQVGNKILIFGGKNESGQTDTCFEYDLTNNTITLAADCFKLPKEASFIHRNGGIFVSDSYVHAIGAKSFNLFSYSIKEHKWTIDTNWNKL